ncbi:hypothetical protein F5890DRAFT_1409388 [Lentinula detonsa]|uniref:ChrR-like cupin domain-containing protein n=1 Tax=Lentinula detonsa TaxID=2804962 RepID=A0AA38Q151_9AGAR|nr:hypothetical protein F5890DRAFT_1409388 [Lentinula detonsa]
MHQKEFTSLPPRPKPYASAEDALPWYSVGPGIWEYSLNSSSSTSTSVSERAVIQWCEPNTKWPSDDSVITHEYIEEVIFLEGGLRDLTLQQEWGPGAYAYRLPGMKHGPYEASEKGCLEFVRCVGVRMEAKDDVNS